MDKPETVLVTGATGNVGSLLVPALVRAGVNVRALVRDEAKAQSIADAGATVAAGDLDQPETLPAALSGVDKVYLLTWNGPTAEQQGLNVIDAAIAAGGPHVVKQSGYGSPKSRIIQHHATVNSRLKSSGLPYTIVEPTFFMQNVMMAAQTVVSDGVIYMPFKEGRVGMIDIRDIADVACSVLTSEGHEGKTYVLTGPESISFHEVANGLSRGLGREVKYVDVPLEAGKQAMTGMGMPEWIADGYIELIAEFANDWGDRVTSNVQDLTGHRARSIEQFGSDFAAVFGGHPATVGR